MEFRLGRSIATIVPFHRIPIKKSQEFITTKLIIVKATSLVNWLKQSLYMTVSLSKLETNTEISK